MTKSMNIKAALKALDVKVHNSGTSTGSKWMSAGKNIASFSPVDGAKIGSVSATTSAEFASHLHGERCD